MQFKDIARRVAAKCDDAEQTYVTEDYVLGFAQDAYEWLYNKLKLTGSQFDEAVVVLPSVQGGTPDLNALQAVGQPLASLVNPRIVRWKLPGTDTTYFTRADGPLDYVRDVAPGIPQLDSWAWIRYSLKLSNFSTPLDLEVSGDFLFDPLTSGDSPIQISLTANRVFSCKLASEVGKARGNDKWAQTYAVDADDALDDLLAAMTKANQSKTERVGRISRSAGNVARVLNNH